MSLSQILNIKTSDNKGLELKPGITYQMLIDSYGSIQFVDLNTGNYIPITLIEVK
jgi:hypothetical protein